MANNFIIKYRTETEETFIDGYLEINKKYNYSTIAINSIKDKYSFINNILFEYIFNGNIQISFDDDQFESKINNLIIKFDSNSSSAWVNYKTLIVTIINTKNEIERYPSGNILCIGDILYKNNKRILHGSGTVFYDKPTNNIMYIGEFENGLFDGSGIFYSLDGNVLITVNNIANGIPKHCGEIKINYPNYELIKEISFYDIWDKLNISSNDAIISFVNSDKFVDTITKLVWTNTKSLEEYKFEVMSPDDKFNLFYSKIKKLEQYNINYNQFLKQINYYNFIQFSIFLFLFIILMTCYLFILFKIY